MKTPTSFGDPQSTTKLRCDVILAAANALPVMPAFLSDLVIATRLPLPTEMPAPGRRLVIRSGAWTEYSEATATNRVRVMAWDLDQDAAWDIASWFHGHLLALPGDDDLVSYQYDSGPAHGVDPDYKTPIVGFAINARMRPAIL